jgi:hypothetical protein
VQPPAATARDRGEFLHIDVDQLTRPFPFVTPHRLSVGGPVAAIESRAPFGAQNALHRRRRDADLERDAVRAPTAFPAQPQDLSMHRPARAVR